MASTDEQLENSILTLPSKVTARIQRSFDVVRYFGKTSTPYLSQDSFRRIADIDFDSKRPVSTREIESARIIFCNSGEVEEFFDVYGKKIQAKILIFGNNDVDFEDFPYFVPNSVKKIYLQNSLISDGLFTTIPIGIENLSHHQNGLPHLFGNDFVSQHKNGKALAGPFGITHEERNVLLSLSRAESSTVDFVQERKSPRKYAHFASTYSQIFAPRGNGLDTHRFWEALYRGSIPVVLKSKWAESIRALGIPLITVDDWASAVRDPLKTPSEFKNFEPKSIPALWEEYWISEIRKFV